MDSIDGLKTCRKGLHQYPADKKGCPECKREYDRIRYLQNPKRRSESNRNWYKKNREHKLEKNQQWRDKNPERQKEYVLRWKRENSEKVRENARQRRKQNPEREREIARRWRAKNGDKVRAKLSRRRARKKQATPPWADQRAIAAVYAEAVRLEKETGIPHHVDHIYPLTSPYLCGLHIAENLQVLPGPENISKSNRIWPGQLECQRLPFDPTKFKDAG